MERSVEQGEGGAGRWAVGPLDLRLVALLAGAKLLVHLATAGRYGYFRDELYFLDCGRHLDWGYVDCAPLDRGVREARASPGRIAPGPADDRGAGGRGAGGADDGAGARDGRRALRPGARRASARSRRRSTSAMDSILTMNGFESLFWMGCVFFVIRIVRTGDSRLWLWFGVLAGLGIENKHSTLLFGGAVRDRSAPDAASAASSRSPGSGSAAAIALLLFLPNILWQVRHGFPTIEDLQNVKPDGEERRPESRRVHRPADPAPPPVALSDLARGARSRFLAGRGSRLRVLGWTYLVLLAVMIASKAKNYYLAPIYPMLFASGAVAIDGWLERRAWSRGRLVAEGRHRDLRRRRGRDPGAGDPAVLPPEKLVAYLRRLGLAPPKTEVRHEGPLEQRLGDQFGWEELVSDVARIYKSLPPEERARTGIFASNYGEAGALNLFGPAYGLPPPICAHQNHYFWGPPKVEPENLIWLQWSRRGVEDHCLSVEKAGEHSTPGAWRKRTARSTCAAACATRSRSTGPPTSSIGIETPCGRRAREKRTCNHFSSY